MDNKVVYINLNDLKPGMIAADDIISEGTVLLSKGVIINNSMIEKLQGKYFMDDIPVYSDDDVKAFKIDSYKQKTIEDVEKSFTEITNDVKSIFENFKEDGSYDLSEIKKFAERIQNELKSTGAVVRNIVLKGSGEDSIYRHCVNVASLSCVLGKWIGLKEDELKLLTCAGILHDFGKIKLDPKVLNKVQDLSEEEIKILKSHPVISYNYIKKIPNIDNRVSIGVLMHHERMDGSGYPLGIKDNKINQFARIIAIADVFDAINSDRVYEKSKGPFQVLEIIYKDSFGKLDYEYSKCFLDHIINYYMGEKVLLNNEKTCKIITIDTNDMLRPLLLGEEGFIDLKKERKLSVKKLVV